MFNEHDHIAMQRAMEEANLAGMRDEVPIGAVITIANTGEIIAANGNRTIELKDPSAHAEILVIREACQRLGAQRIPECALYVTLEPCTMCAGAISFSRVQRLIIGAEDSKGGGVFHGARFYEQGTCHHKPEVVSGLMSSESGELLRGFFRSKRALKKK